MDHPAVRALEPLCFCQKDSSVSHWPELALELIAFLELRQRHGDHVGCGGDVEALWRRMLLETSVADGVHELLGGQVPHSLRPPHRASQVLALNLLLMDGRTLPTLRYWALDEEVQTVRIKHHGTDRPVYVPLGSGGTADRSAAEENAPGLVERPREMGMQIFVRGCDRRIRTYQMDLYDDIWTLKVAIRLTMGIPESEQRLTFAGKMLENGRTLAHYNVQKDSEVHLSIRMRGC